MAASPQFRIVHAVCSHDCPDSCAVLVTVNAEGRAVKVEGDPRQPVTRGFLCGKVAKYLDRVYAPDRVLYPLKRKPGAPKGTLRCGSELEVFDRVSWDEALDAIAARLREIASKTDLNQASGLWSSMEEIAKAGERAVGLTRQLLAFSRKQILKPRVLDLNRVVEDLRPMLARLMGEDVQVRVALQAVNGTVRADPHHLEQVIMNLAVNARDAMPLGGKLLIETAGVELDAGYARLHPGVNEGRYVMLALSDSGEGMDEGTRRRIFEPFFTTKPAGKGTGLGLSMVQGIVVQSGGHISVYSEPGRGTTFRIYLPAVADLAANAEAPAGDAPLGGSETILVVEDLAEVRAFAVAALKAYGYRVIQAENASQALLLCQRERGRVHLVLTDVVMPNLSGPELASRLKKLRPGIKVLLMSGYTDNAVSIDGTLDERLHFIEKPFSPEQLAKKVRAVLGPATD